MTTHPQRKSERSRRDNREWEPAWRGVSASGSPRHTKSSPEVVPSALIGPVSGSLSPRANQPANSCVRTSGLRATSATPAKRGGAVGAPEGLHEVARIAVADPPANLLNREVLLWSRR